MKIKISIIFFLFTISLFAEFNHFKHRDYGFSIATKTDNILCEIVLSKQEGVIGLTFLVQPTTYEPINLEIDNLIVNLTDFFTVGDSFVCRIYSINDMKNILQKIVSGKKIYIKTEYGGYLFDFTKYKNDISKNNAYKELMSF